MVLALKTGSICLLAAKFLRLLLELDEILTNLPARTSQLQSTPTCKAKLQRRAQTTETVEQNMLDRRPVLLQYHHFLL